MLFPKKVARTRQLALISFSPYPRLPHLSGGTASTRALIHCSSSSNSKGRSIHRRPTTLLFPPPHSVQVVAFTTGYPVQGSQPSSLPSIIFTSLYGVSVSRLYLFNISFAAHRKVEDRRLNGVSAFVVFWGFVRAGRGRDGWNLGM